MFFENEFAEVWLCFIEKQAALFHSAVKKVEGQNVPIIEESVTLTELLKKLENRIAENFIPSDISEMLSNHNQKDAIVKHVFILWYCC